MYQMMKVTLKIHICGPSQFSCFCCTPYLLLSATLCGLEPFQLASFSCSVVLFTRFHRFCRLTAKLRYENKQFATNAPLQTLLFACPRRY